MPLKADDWVKSLDRGLNNCVREKIELQERLLHSENEINLLARALRVANSDNDNLRTNIIDMKAVLGRLFIEIDSFPTNGQHWQKRMQLLAAISEVLDEQDLCTEED